MCSRGRTRGRWPIASPARALVLAALLATFAAELTGLAGPHAEEAPRGLGLLGGVRADGFRFDLNEPAPMEEEEEEDDDDVEMAHELEAPDEMDATPSHSAAHDGEHEEDSARLWAVGPDPFGSGGRAQPQEPRGLLAGVWSSVKQRLPAYFDFGEFTRKFKRNYKAAEAHLRRSIFVAKCVEIFKSRVAYRMGKAPYLQTVNKFTDQSRQEIALMFQPAPPPELAAGPQSVFVRQLAERRRLLDEAQSQPAYLMEVDTQGAGEDEEARVARELSEFYARQEAQAFSRRQEEAVAAALEAELRELAMETMTQSSLGLAGPSLPWPGQLRSAELADRDTGGHQGPGARALAEYRPPLERLGGRGGLDWSQHECFHQVYDQGKQCGQCYVMASTALAEFYKCSEAGPGRPASKRKFSKQYVLGCAQKFAPTVMGCAGGSPLDTLRFIARSGIWNIPQWKLKRQKSLSELRQAGESPGAQDELDLSCPLNPHRVPFEQWGAIKVILNPKAVGPNEWLEALEDGPLVASVQMPPEGVDSYAGGVHDGQGCATSGLWHAMVLVGYGTGDHGEPYWRFRNSFGPDWGDRGHFNLAMSVPAACLAGGVRVFREPLDS